MSVARGEGLETTESGKTASKGTGVNSTPPRLISQSLNSSLEVEWFGGLAKCAVCQIRDTGWIFTVTYKHKLARYEWPWSMRWRECPDCQTENHKALVEKFLMVMSK